MENCCLQELITIKRQKNIPVLLKNVNWYKNKRKVLPTIYGNMLWFLRWHATIPISKEKVFLILRKRA